MALFPTSQTTHHVGITVTKLLVLFRATMSVYSENHTKDSN